MVYPARLLAGLFACVLILAVPALAQGAENLTPQRADTPEIAHVDYPGIKHLHYQYGSLPIQAGQNNIQVGANEVPRPKVDGWITRMKPNLTFTLGLRYSLYSPPYEKNGNQVAPNISLGDWFQLRGRNAANGIPSNAAPRISFDLAGAANGKKGF